jgi:hypothetical protein
MRSRPTLIGLPTRMPEAGAVRTGEGGGGRSVSAGVRRVGSGAGEGTWHRTRGDQGLRQHEWRDAEQERRRQASRCHSIAPLRYTHAPAPRLATPAHPSHRANFAAPPFRLNAKRRDFKIFLLLKKKKNWSVVTAGCSRSSWAETSWAAAEGCSWKGERRMHASIPHTPAACRGHGWRQAH